VRQHFAWQNNCPCPRPFHRTLCGPPPPLSWGGIAIARKVGHLQPPDHLPVRWLFSCPTAGNSGRDLKFRMNSMAVATTNKINGAKPQSEPPTKVGICPANSGETLTPVSAARITAATNMHEYAIHSQNVQARMA
jgi:hypothetical protein